MTTNTTTNVDITVVRALAEREGGAVRWNGRGGRSGAVLDLTRQILTAAADAADAAADLDPELVPVPTRLLDAWHAAMAEHCERRAAELAASWQCDPSMLAEDHPVAEHLEAIGEHDEPSSWTGEHYYRPSTTMRDLVTRLQHDAWATKSPTHAGGSDDDRDGAQIVCPGRVGTDPCSGVTVRAWVSHHDIGDGVGSDFSEVTVPLFTPPADR